MGILLLGPEITPALLMKTALYVTDGSVDSALLLRHWLTEQHATACRLTVVLPYETEPGERLHKDALRPAKAAAESRLQTWSAMLGDVGLHRRATQTLFASPEHALTIHLLMFHYDYWLVDDNQQMVSLAGVLTRTATQAVWLPGVFADVQAGRSAGVSPCLQP